MALDFSRVKKETKTRRESSYQLSDRQAEDQIIDFVTFYDIDLTFDIAGLMDEDGDAKQKTKEEKQAGIGMKQILKDLAHFIRKGTVEIQRNKEDLVILHRLIEPIGEESEDSAAKKELTYRSIRPKDTEAMASLGEDFTFAQKAETLMGYLSDEGLPIINALGVLDKKACRSVGILLLVAQ